MCARLLVIICLFISASSLAIEKSKIGLDYLKLTKNQILAEIMLDLEPKLLASYDSYKKFKFTDLQKKFGVRGVAISFSKDITYKDTIDEIKRISPDTLLKLLRLSKEDYPMLWAVGEGERLERELASSLKLYKALHGKEYIDK